MTSRLRRLAVVLLGPLWVRTFRDPVRDGRLRLGALSRVERQLARAALVLLAVLLGSVLFSSAWRSGPLLELSASANENSFVPAAALPVALFALFVALAALCWGALDASPSVRVVVALAHLVAFSALSLTDIGLGSGSWVLVHLRAVVATGYYGVPAALLLSAALHPVVRRRPRAAAVTTWAARVVVLASLVVLLGGLGWANVEAERRGLAALIPGLFDSSIGQIGFLLVPLVYVAAVAVIDFALDVSTSLTEPTRVLRRRGLLVVLVAVLLAKVVRQVVLRWDAWVAQLTYQPVAFWRTAVTLLVLGLVVAAVTRFPSSEDHQLAKERATYGGAFVLAAPSLVPVVTIGFALWVSGQFDSDLGSTLTDWIPYARLQREGLLVAAVVTLLVGVRLVRRSAGGFGDELGSALVVLGAWVTTYQLPNVVHAELGFSIPTVDLLVTAGVAAVLAVRWRTLTPGALVALTTLLAFSWLVVSRGDYLSFLGGLVGLPAILVVVFGIVLTLASGSAFASSGSKRLPADARPLLYVGYLLLSVAILFWVEVTHEADQDALSLVGFQVLGIPMAAWLAGRRILARRPGESLTP